MTRFGYRFIADYLLLNGIEVVIKEKEGKKALLDGDLNKELVEDLIVISYSFSGKFFCQ